MMDGMTPDAAGAWPTLELDAWADTLATFHMWAQIVGKVRLALEPMRNHWWQVPLYVSSRGLTTSLMHAGALGVEIEFDFPDDVLEVRTTAGATRAIALAPCSVAGFYAETMAVLHDVGVDVHIMGRPVEVVDAIPFAEDEQHRAFDGDALRAFWGQLVATHRVMERFASGFVGKQSPLHWFWGALDLAQTRFSGRRAPRHPGGMPNTPDRVAVLGYSHELSSVGFWPGGDGEGAFYAYAYPEPAGYRDRQIAPGEARYDHALGEFLLPYSSVRTAADPDAQLLSFFDSAYAAAAELGHWDRAALEAQSPLGES
jgi:hypothetical protein